jgi:hypothetical protein
VGPISGSFHDFAFREKEMLAPGKPLIHEITKSGFHISGLRAMGALGNENPKLSIPKIAEVKSTTLFFSQTNDLDLPLHESGFCDP